MVRLLLRSTTGGERWVLAGYGWRSIRSAVASIMFALSLVVSPGSWAGIAVPWYGNAGGALLTGTGFWWLTLVAQLHWLRRHPRCRHCTYQQPRGALHGSCRHCCYCRSPLPPAPELEPAA